MQNIYQYYKSARDASWKTLIECGITSLPIDLTKIAEYYRIEFIKYSECGFIGLLNPEAISGDGFITTMKDTKIIFINDKIQTRGRRRFTFGHELGHAILNHPLNNVLARNDEIDSVDSPLEMQANVFSRGILAPTCVLNALKVTTAEEIMQLCDISQISANIRLERMQELYKRQRFLTSPLERQVYEQFKDFINERRCKN